MESDVEAGIPAPHSTSTESSASWLFRPDIEGLRAVAILGVILFHAGLRWFPAGFLGVDVFFVLSGFLITGILWHEVQQTGTISLPAFWARRARRLLPAATLVSVVTLLVLVRSDSPFAEARYAGSALSFATYWSNILFWRRGADYFDPGVATDPFLHTWSLAVEEQYYLLFAPGALLLALLIRRRSPERFRRRLFQLTTIVGLLSLVVWLRFSSSHPVIAFYGLPTRAWEFGLGGALALLPVQRGATAPGWFGPAAWLGLAAIAGSWLLPVERTAWAGAVTMIPTAGTALLLWLGTAGSGPSFVGRVLEAPLMRWIGRLSYSWYLWHWPLTIYWDRMVPDNPIPMALGMPLLSLGLAQLTYLCIEHPARRGRWLQPVRRGLLAAPVLAALTGASALLLSRHARQRLAGAEYAPIVSARDEQTRLHLDGCDRQASAEAVARCTYGERNADSTLVLFGDSHAAQWFPALEPLALERRWRLVVLTKPGCPSVQVQVWSSMPNRTVDVCQRWREDAIARVRELRPFLIVLSNYRRHSLQAEPGGPRHPAAEQPELWRRGLEQVLGLLPLESQILLLGDTPTPRLDVPACLVEHDREAARCEFARDSATAPALTRVERELSRLDPRVRYADLTDAVCASPRCPVVREGVVLYSDDNHLSVSFVVRLTGQIRALLDTTLAGAKAAH